MVEVILEDTSIKMYVGNAKDLHSLYFRLGHYFTFIINGDKLKRAGEKDDNSVFGGYTVGYFQAHYFD